MEIQKEKETCVCKTGVQNEHCIPSATPGCVLFNHSGTAPQHTNYLKLQSSMQQRLKWQKRKYY